jgi:hypothetical protein
VKAYDEWSYKLHLDGGNVYAYYLPLQYKDSLSLGDDFLIEKYVNRPETLAFYYAMYVKDQTIYVFNSQLTTCDGLAYWFYD